MASWKTLLRPALPRPKVHRAAPAGVHTKLDLNESPFALPDDVVKALSELLARVPLQRYPDSNATRLKDVWSSSLEAHPSQMVLGNGSDELIGLVLRSFGVPRRSGRPPRVGIPVPSFPGFRAISIAHGWEPVDIASGPGFAPSEKALEGVLREAEPNLVFLDRPNNPTGAQWAAGEIERAVIGHPECVFVVDEACGEYATDSMAWLASRFPNLVVLRSLSKRGMAGLRVGTLIAHPEVAAELERGRLPYNIGSYAQLAATYLLENHEAWFAECVRVVVEERSRVTKELRTVHGVIVYPSQANFVLLEVPSAELVWAGLLERGVLVQDFTAPAVLAQCLRVTIGTREENDRFLEAFGQTLRLTRINGS